MPIKLNWSRGRNLGLALIYLGIMGLIQVLFIIIAQYGMKVGSFYVITIIPAGIMLATFYAVIVVFENSTTVSKFREARPFIQRKTDTGKGSESKGLPFKIDMMYLRPILYVVIVFAVLFGIMVASLWSMTKPSWNKDTEKWDAAKLDAATIYVIASNVGAIASLIFAAYFETDAIRKTR